MRRAALTAAIAAAIAGVAPASAQDNSFVIVSFGLGNPRTVKQWDLPVRWEGSVVTRFDAGFGSGEVVWTPGGRGQLTIAENRTRNGRRMTAFLGATSAPGAHARVQGPTGLCTDTASQPFEGAAVSSGKDGIRIALAGSSAHAGGFHMSETACGGPLVDDIGRALGMVMVSRRQLTRGSFDIDFRGSAPVFAPGMHATVDSTVIAHVGARLPSLKPSRDESGGSHAMTVGYRVERVSGALHADLAGAGELCSELNSCGHSEALDLKLGKPHDAGVRLTAFVPDRRPVADLRAALGLPSHGGRRTGVDWAGYGPLSSRSNILAASVQSAGAPVCKDERHIPGVALRVAPTRDRVVFDLVEDGVATLRTSCPGPDLSGGAFDRPLASGSIPLRALGRKRVTVRLTRGQAIETDGWSGRSRANFTIVLRRESVSSRHFEF